MRHSDGSLPVPGVSVRSSPSADSKASGMTGRGPCQPQGRNSWPSLSKAPQSFSQQTFAFSVRWSDDSDTFVRRSWDEFKTLQVSELGANPTAPAARPTNGSRLGICPCAREGVQLLRPPSWQGTLTLPREPVDSQTNSPVLP